MHRIVAHGGDTLLMEMVRSVAVVYRGLVAACSAGRSEIVPDHGVGIPLNLKDEDGELKARWSLDVASLEEGSVDSGCLGTEGRR
jgi:hypothetical protein